jgi:calcineurin-like phosphoesterase family protein
MNVRIIVIADLHFISDRDPARDLAQSRRIYAISRPNFRKLADKINASSPDLIVLLGDLVDWHSPENVDDVLEMLAELKAPWHAVPGNHEFSQIEQTDAGWRFVNDYQAIYSPPVLDWRSVPDHAYARIHAFWSARGVAFHNRTITCDGVSLWLMDSALSEVPPGTGEWLDGAGRHDGTNLLFTHVPPDTPENRTTIITREPYRDLNKYVQSKAPGLYEGHIRNRFSHVFSGHLGVPYVIPHDRLTCHILGQWGTALVDVGAKGASVNALAT